VIKSGIFDRASSSPSVLFFAVDMDTKSNRSRDTNPSFSMEDFAQALEQHDYQFQKGQVVRGRVASYDSAGAYIDIGGKSAAFLPKEEASLRQVVDLAETLPLEEERDFLIVREQDEDGQVTLSVRQLEIKKIWTKLAELQEASQTVQVRVTGTNKGGVTVNVKGLRGFIPRSHLVERNDLEGLVGQTIAASFLEVDPERKKIVLSNRLATRAASLSGLEIGQLVTGSIASIKPFGLFVEFGGATGLLHINQISKNYIESLNTIFQVGQPIKAIILDLDEGKGRISLSTKLLENYPGEMIENPTEVMAEAETRQERAQKSLKIEG
jgi:small subunit ribosomal protein S1